MKTGNPVTDPNKVNALLPIAGAKGYGLMMMVDIFSGILTGVPFGKRCQLHVPRLLQGKRAWTDAHCYGSEPLRRTGDI